MMAKQNITHIKRKSVTLIEVIVGAIILASVFAGLIGAFFSVRRYISHDNNRLISANLIIRSLMRCNLQH